MFFTVYEDLTFVKLSQMVRDEHKDTPVWTIDGKVFLNVDGRVRPYIPSADKTRLPLYSHSRQVKFSKFIFISLWHFGAPSLGSCVVYKI